MSQWIYAMIFTAAGLLTGGILFSYHLPLWIAHVDVTACSKDHNPGTANAIQYAGVPIGLFCLLLDMGKGYIVVAAAQLTMDTSHVAFAFVLAAPVIGHSWAPFYPGMGGKGIAVSFGSLLALLPRWYFVLILAGIYLFFSLLVVIRPNERRTVFSFAFFALVVLFLVPFTGQGAIALGCCIISGIVMEKNWVWPWKEEGEPEKGEEVFGTQAGVLDGWDSGSRKH